METNFKDFKPEELIGKTVLHESGMSYGNSSKRITTISKVTKTAFRIKLKDTDSDELYNIQNGHVKGKGGRMNMGYNSNVYLITEEEKNNFIKEWKEKREIIEMKKRLEETMNTLTHEKLTKIINIIHDL